MIVFFLVLKRFDNSEVLTLHDPDGSELELVAHKSAVDRTVIVWKEALNSY